MAVDSEVERAFLAELMAAGAQVRVYAKLPRLFRVPTPLGWYEPDWAVLVEESGEERVYLVVETKGTLFEAGLRGREKAKIDCGRAHFAELAKAGRENPPRYAVATTLSEARPRL